MSSNTAPGTSNPWIAPLSFSTFSLMVLFFHVFVHLNENILHTCSQVITLFTKLLLHKLLEFDKLFFQSIEILFQLFNFLQVVLRGSWRLLQNVGTLQKIQWMQTVLRQNQWRIPSA